MTLSFECVAQNWPLCARMHVGSTKLIVHPNAYSGTRGVVLEITRLTKEYCKVREVNYG
jgi:hypothetical protein